MEQTENSLYGYANGHKRVESLQAAAAAQKCATEIAREQYFAGILAQIDLLTAERALLDAENDLVVAKAELGEQLVNLYKSLGE